MAGVQFKLMPENPDVDLTKVLEDSKKVIEEKGGIFSSSEEQPIAFGLKALILSIAYPEENDVDLVGNGLNELEGVSSAEMTDYRRAIG